MIDAVAFDVAVTDADTVAVTEKLTARDLVLMHAELTPDELAFCENPQAALEDVQVLLYRGLSKLLGISGEPPGFQAMTRMHHIRMEIWPQYQEARQRLDALRDVYPELVFTLEVVLLGSASLKYFRWYESITDTAVFQKVPL